MGRAIAVRTDFSAGEVRQLRSERGMRRRHAACWGSRQWLRGQMQPDRRGGPSDSAGRTEPGTINALVVAYYNSADWANLAVDTRTAIAVALLRDFAPSTATSACGYWAANTL